MVLYALETLEGVRHVMLCILEVVEGELSFAGDAGVARGNALCTLYAGGCGG
jgi:hypothetical protein